MNSGDSQMESGAGLVGWSPGVWLCRVGACALVGVVLSLAGCGGVGGAGIAVSRRVPRGAVAVVGAAPVTVASFEHWLAIVRRGEVTGGSRGRAVGDTVSFLVKAQWLVQESRAEGINASVLDKRVAQRTAQAPPRDGMTGADVAFQVRLDVIAEALQSRHTDVPVSVTAAQVARYYAAHKSRFERPGSRPVLVVATRTLASALTARAALLSGRKWATVAKEYSVDPSKIFGGRSAVVANDASPALERAVFTARRGRIVGPVRTPSPSSSSYYYVFEAIAPDKPGSPQSLSEVASQIRQTLTQQSKQQAWASFSSAYAKRWSARTLCAPDYVVRECRNYASTAG